MEDQSEMPLQMNTEVATALAQLVDAAAAATPPPAGDWQTRRTNGDAMVLGLTGAWAPPPDVSVSEHQAIGLS